MTYRAFAFVLALPLALSAQDTTAAKASLLAADRAASASVAALARALTPDASVLLPGLDVLRGRAAYAPHLPLLMKSASGHAPYTPLHAVVSRDGQFGCTTGILHPAASDSTQPTAGRYAACWQRVRNGAWQMTALHASPAPPQVKALPDSIANAPASSGAAAPRGAQPAREMADADRAFAAFSADSGGPGGAFARWIAADGMMLGARAVPVRGSEQVRNAFAGYPANGKFEWGPIDALTRAAPDGSLGFTIGEARLAPTPAEVSYSKYLTVWRREPGGHYRFVFDIGTDRPAPKR